MMNHILDYIQTLVPDESVLDTVDAHARLLEAAFEKEGLLLNAFANISYYCQ